MEYDFHPWRRQPALFVQTNQSRQGPHLGPFQNRRMDRRHSLLPLLLSGQLLWYYVLLLAITGSAGSALPTWEIMSSPVRAPRTTELVYPMTQSRKITFSVTYTMGISHWFYLLSPFSPPPSWHSLTCSQLGHFSSCLAGTKRQGLWLIVWIIRGGTYSHSN